MTPTVSRSTARPTVPALGYLAVVVLLAGCASVLDGEGSGGGGRTDDPGSAPYDHASGPEDVLVSIKVDGGFVPVEYNLRNTPELLLLGDGTAIVGGVMIEIYPGPAIAPMQSATVPEGQIQQLFAAADDAGLLEPDIDFGEPPVADAPNTTVTIAVDGRTVIQTAYALGTGDEAAPGLSENQIATRESLQSFIDAAHSLADSASAAYEPSGVVAYRLRPDATSPLEDPGLEQSPLLWPITTAPAVPEASGADLATCAVVSGAEAPTLLAAIAGANELTPWLIGTDPPARMVFRPFLPGDPGCEA